ncbi:MAG TPA: twin-arginine translocase TatA/TatE family subunit [Pyrinomonadaceae bacterium]|jgi:sec-independent protein translocase protein TatA|nr:twin-arginine translocase TatA/TatE family subunit [Pyrinomonadaceae bacterium]
MSHLLAIGTPGVPELLIILVVLLLLFGGTRLPQLAKGMGKSIREFKRGINSDGTDDDDADTVRGRERLRAADAERIREEELASDKFTVNKPR